MSELSQSAHVAITLADYAAIESGGNKVTLVGASIAFVRPQTPGSLQSAPFSLCVVATFAPKFVDEQVSLVMVLENEHGDPYKLPGPVVGTEGALDTFQVAAKERLGVKPAPEMVVPDGVIRPRMTAVLNFSNGLPLHVGAYRWRVSIDGDTRDEWTEAMYVPEIDLSRIPKQ